MTTVLFDLTLVRNVTDKDTSYEGCGVDYLCGYVYNKVRKLNKNQIEYLKKLDCSVSGVLNQFSQVGQTYQFNIDHLTFDIIYKTNDNEMKKIRLEDDLKDLIITIKNDNDLALNSFIINNDIEATWIKNSSEYDKIQVTKDNEIITEQADLNNCNNFYDAIFKYFDLKK